MIFTKLKKLKIKNFRNLEDDLLEFSEGINCIFGKNGNGKTNLLEAIHLIGMGKSFKKNTAFPQVLSLDSEEPEILFQSLFLDMEREEISYSGKIKPVKSEFFVNQRKSPKRNNLKLVFINPYDFYGFFQTASFRRNWFDTYFSQLSDSYKAVLNRYNSSLKMRNALLTDKPSDYRGQIKAFDKEFAKYNVILRDHRVQACNELLGFLPGMFQKLFSEDHNLTVQVTSKFKALNEKQVFEALQGGLEKDIILGHTHYGVHRDDYLLLFDGYTASEVCSLGQQKMAFLSLLFAYIELFKYKFKTYPMVLIDDVSGELDKLRWGNLITYLEEKEFQALITTANEDFRTELEKINGSKRFFVEEGSFTTLS